MNKKKVIAAVLVFILVFGLVFLMSAFVNLSFDITKWSEVSRKMVGVFGLGIAAMFSVAAALW